MLFYLSFFLPRKFIFDNLFKVSSSSRTALDDDTSPPHDCAGVAYCSRWAPQVALQF